MEIAILHWGFPPVIGGVETRLSLLGKEKYTKEIMVDNILKVYEKTLTGTKGEMVSCARTRERYCKRRMNPQGVIRTGMTGGGS